MQVRGYQAIDAKLEELAQSVLEQAAYKQCRQMIEDFSKDEASIQQYEQFVQLQEELQEKEQQGLSLTEQEMENYNQEERRIYDNDRIRKFIYAQKELISLQDALTEYFNKAIERGRLPQAKELKKVMHGCGSHNR